MPKSRFSAADIRGIVRDLRGKVLGLRCINVYDISAKIYLIKLGAPGVSEKPTLLLESGMRFHSTSFVRDKSDMPSGKLNMLRNQPTKRPTDRPTDRLTRTLLHTIRIRHEAPKAHSRKAAGRHKAARR